MQLSILCSPSKTRSENTASVPIQLPIKKQSAGKFRKGVSLTQSCIWLQIIGVEPVVHPSQHIPIALQSSRNVSKPYCKMGLISPMRITGICTHSRSAFNCSINKWSVIPFLRATLLLCWIAVPSAVGSENGIPISTMSAPASCSDRTIGTISFKPG